MWRVCALRQLIATALLVYLTTQPSRATIWSSSSVTSEEVSRAERGRSQIEFEGIAEDSSAEACQSNTQRLSHLLQHNASNNVIRIARVNETYHFFPGIYTSHMHDATLILDGTMRFEKRNENNVWYGDTKTGSSDDDDATNFPGTETNTLGRRPEPCWMMDQSHNVTLTSSSPQHRGLIDGRGSQYWGVPGIGYLQVAEHRPRLLQINLTTDLTISNLILQDSPYHTLYLEAVRDVRIHDMSIVARRTNHDGHGWIDLTAFNTDGIDVSGTNVHIHDVDIWTQDDCIAIKDNILQPPYYESTNMLIERVNCSGLGFVIGSIGGSTVRNITFRNSYLYRSVKGIYLKFRHLGDWEQELNLTGRIEDIVFENITMEQPLQWPIWIGPAQQSDTRRPCAARPCSLCWPQNPAATCDAVDASVYRNLTLRRVRINNPIMSPGVLLGGDTAVLDGILFDTVQVTQGPPVAEATVDRSISFPGLLQRIEDHFIPRANQGPMKHTASTNSLYHTWNRTGLDESTLHQEDEPGTNETTDEKGWFNRHHPIWILFITWHLLLLLYFIRKHSVGVTGTRYRTLESSVQQETDDDDARSEVDVVDDKSSLPRGSSRTRRLAITLVFVIAELILVALLYNATVLDPNSSAWQAAKPKWNRIDKYFRCQGVLNGVATGSTWPVPSCFTTIDQK